MNIPAIDRTEVPAALRLAVECAIEEAEELGDIPQRLHAQLRDSGAFRLLTPREYGGVEMPLTEALELYEKFGHIDASTGLLVWNANFGFMAALLDEAAAQTIWADDREPVLANSASSGMAERVRGGFRLSGRWEIVTGINHADWFVGIGVVHHCDGPATSAAEAPEVRVFVVPRSQFVVEDTWDTTGTRGSGSNAVVVTNASIPFDMTFTIDQPARIDRPLYRGFIPALVLPGVAAVVLGTARRVIERRPPSSPTRKR
jgi:alkylation response protein AidB-like acyl-CoA dehydrogenase